MDVAARRGERHEASAASSFPWAMPPVVVPNGVDVARWILVDDEEHADRAGVWVSIATAAGSVRRGLAGRKQIDLVRGWNHVRARVPGAMLALVGDGQDRASITATAGRSPRRRRDSDVQHWYDAADVAVQPSRWEGMSYATIEAMASGLPVVAFDVGGMRQALGAGDHLLAPTTTTGCFNGSPACSLTLKDVATSVIATALAPLPCSTRSRSSKRSIAR